MSSAQGLGWRGVVYGLASNALLPAVSAWSLLNPRLRAHWDERIGWTTPAVEPGAIWLHAASLGEGQAAAAVAAALAERWPDVPLLRTATSAAGRAQPLPVDDARLLPLDAPWLQRRFVRRVRPRALVLVEGELWPGLLAACAGGIPVAVLGLRVGQGTRRLARRLPGLWRTLLGTVRIWSARDAQDAAWLEQSLGRPVPVIGDLKLEAPLAPPALRFSRALLLAGSTRPGDEQALLAAWRGLPSPPQLVLAPRHADRWGEVAELLDRSGLRWQRRSALAGPAVPADLDALLLDSIGELAGLYPLASVAFVGGTFDTTIGGHSAAEAVRAGVPVVHGPHTHANASSFAEASCHRAGSPAALGAALVAALGAPKPAPPVGQAAKRALELLAPLVEGPVPPEVPLRPLLAPLVPAYRLASALRARRPRRTAACPVISVGNIASGGTGKTPVVRWLLEALLRRGLRPAVVSRGYGRAPGPDLRDNHGDPCTDASLGDELAMLGQLCGVLVSCPDRARGVARAVELGARICLLDDGMQQRDVEVALEVVVVDARWPRAGGLLPVGEAREPLDALERADLVWCNHGPLPPDVRAHVRPDAIEVRARPCALGWRWRGVDLPLAEGPRGAVAVLCGIARPAGFLRQLRALGLLPAQRLLFPDHHHWTVGELARIRAQAGSLPIVTTEKDLARLPEGFDAAALRIGLGVERGEVLEARLDRFLASHGLVGAP